jgi:hypothetical protein
MTEFAIEPVILKQRSGREFFPDNLIAGTVLEIETIHHTYTLIIRRSRSLEVILVGNDREHSVPRIYRFSLSFSIAEENPEIILGIMREGFQLEFIREESDQEITLQISYVKSIRLHEKTLRTWILRKSFEKDFLGRLCNRLVSKYSRFLTGATFL